MYDEPCCGVSSLEEKRVPRVRLDITKVSMVGDVSLNDEVSMTITGRVTSIRGPEEYITHEWKNGKQGKEVERLSPGSLEVEVSKVKIATVGEFDKMDEDE